MAEQTLSLRNNQEALALFGKHDQHLRRIEQALGIAIVARGAELKLSGADEGAVADALTGAGAGAKAVLDDYALMDTGIEEVCARLESEGVKSFLDSHRKLLAAVEGRLKGAVAG